MEERSSKRTRRGNLPSCREESNKGEKQQKRSAVPTSYSRHLSRCSGPRYDKTFDPVVPSLEPGFPADQIVDLDPSFTTVFPYSTLVPGYFHYALIIMSADSIPTGLPGAGDGASFGTPGSNSSAFPPPPPPPPLFYPVGPRDAKLGQVYVAATAILLALCLLTFGTRMYNRMRPAWNVGLDDYFITAGVVCAF
jgi:hypothetical protein